MASDRICFEQVKNILKRVCTPENVAAVHQKMLQSPTKLTQRLLQETDISHRSCGRILHLDLHMYPYWVSVVHALKLADAPQCIQFCEWLFTEITTNGLDMDLFFISDEAWFHLGGYVNSKNHRFWAVENPHNFHKTPLHDQKAGVWCAVSAHRIIGPIFFHQTLNSARYIYYIFYPFVAALTEEEKTYSYFQHNGATAHTAGRTLEHIYTIFTPNRVIIRGQSGLCPTVCPSQE